MTESQGPLVNRTLEHLGAADTVLMVMRKMMLDAIGDVAEDRDPKDVIRAASQNGLVLVRNFGAAEATSSG